MLKKLIKSKKVETKKKNGGRRISLMRPRSALNVGQQAHYEAWQSSGSKQFTFLHSGPRPSAKPKRKRKAPRRNSDENALLLAAQDEVSRDRNAKQRTSLATGGTIFVDESVSHGESCSQERTSSKDGRLRRADGGASERAGEKKKKVK